MSATLTAHCQKILQTPTNPAVGSLGGLAPWVSLTDTTYGLGLGLLLTPWGNLALLSRLTRCLETT